MPITVDLRSLHTKDATGVEYFTTHVLEPVLMTDSTHQYTLYYNGFQPKKFEQFHFLNVNYKQTRIPNRLLNFAFKFLKFPTMETLSGEDGPILMPNPNMIALRSTTKLTLVIHDLSPILMPEMYSWKAQLWHRFINLPKLIHRADKLIAVSEFTKQTLINELRVPSEKISVAKLGVDHERFHANLDIDQLRSVRNRYGLPGEFILYLGTLEPRKNIGRLIQAFEQLAGDAHLVIAGKLGWRYNQIFELINQSPKQKRIHYLGYVPEVDKPGLLKLASVLAWPSLYEGFGLPPLEAAAVGTPVVTSNLTSLPEVMADSALLVNPYNIEEIAHALEVLLTQDTVREQFVRRGLERVKIFNWQKTADQVIKALH